MLALFGLALALVAGLAPAYAEKRVALIVANADYDGAALPNPLVDAGLVEASLERVGFSVELVPNADFRTFDKAVTEFADRANGADVALFYYAGHGFAVSKGVRAINVLMARNADLSSTSPRELLSGGLDLDDIVAQISARAKTTLVFIDACRVAPGARGPASVARGLAALAPIEGGARYVVFSTSLGAAAGDGVAGRGSPFARALAAAIPTPGLRIDDVYREVFQAVSDETGRQQLPEVVDDHLPRGSIALAAPEAMAPATVAGPAPKPPPDDAAERPAAYDAAMGAGTVDALDAFLAKYPDGGIAKSAKRERDRLAKLAIQAAPAVPTPTAIGPCKGPTTASLASRGAGALSADELCALKPRSVFQECADCPAMVVVPEGAFTMGSPADEPGRSDDEGPQHRVTIARMFAVGKFDVTKSEFAAFVHAADHDAGTGWTSPGFAQTSSDPVVNVSWNDAKAYVKWLSAKTGATYRLLSESEWEYAARAGVPTAYYWGASLGTNNANCFGCGSRWDFARTSPAGAFAANAFGLYDMHGNAWQWVEDCHHDSYDGAPEDGSPVISGECGQRVYRGGSWYNRPRFLRAADRGYFVAPMRVNYLGFRVARTLLP
jgi:formylglycine-generating enzyme required for sulfatase activity